MKNFFVIIFVLLLIPTIQLTNASPTKEIVDESGHVILISLSDTVENVIFDGKWTERSEWKQSSWDIIKSDGIDAIHLRSAHQGDFIYILLDVVGDQTLNHVSDRALVCIDGNNDKTKIANENDFCFQTSLESKQGFVYQGGSSLALNGNFEKISNSFGFIGIGGKIRSK